jgi:Rrf2 family cysteine metabolism transcriptional repressor
MLVLALLYKEEAPVPLSEIANREQISIQYLEQLFGELRRSGLVRSVRGARGGYLLTRPPEEITVGDVVRVLEGPVSPVGCIEEGTDDCNCGREEHCLTKNVWLNLRDTIVDFFDSITLAGLLAEEASRVKK